MSARKLRNNKFRDEFVMKEKFMKLGRGLVVTCMILGFMLSLTVSFFYIIDNRVMAKVENFIGVNNEK